LTIIRKITKKLKRKNTSVDPRLLICVECGSYEVTVNGKKLECKNCGIKRKFKKSSQKLTNFSKGDLVRVVEYDKPSEQIYKIRKVRKTKDGSLQYLIKSDESQITLLYHESINSYLEKAG
jgi:DNA-directed RNA polymerase subunit RPC12/RpoP